MSSKDPFYDLRILVDLTHWDQLSTMQQGFGQAIASQPEGSKLAIMSMSDFIKGKEIHLYKIWHFIEPDEFQYQLEQLPPMHWSRGELATIGSWEGFQCCEGSALNFHATYIAAQQGHFYACRPAFFDYKKALQELQEQGLVLA